MLSVHTNLEYVETSRRILRRKENIFLFLFHSALWNDNPSAEILFILPRLSDFILTPQQQLENYRENPSVERPFMLDSVNIVRPVTFLSLQHIAGLGCNIEGYNVDLVLINIPHGPYDICG
jgi:hypothetical protein